MINVIKAQLTSSRRGFLKYPPPCLHLPIKLALEDGVFHANAHFENLGAELDICMLDFQNRRPANVPHHDGLGGENIATEVG